MLAVNIFDTKGITEFTSTTTKIQKGLPHTFLSQCYTPRRIHGRHEVDPLQLLPGLIVPAKINVTTTSANGFYLAR